MTDEEKKAQEAAAAAAAEAETEGGASGEAGTQSEGETETKEKTPQEIIFERVRTSRPDGKYDDDEQEVYRQLTAMLDEAEEGNGKYKGLTEKLMRRYQEDPEEVAALLDYMEGMPLLAAVRKHKGDEALTIKEGDEGWDEYQKAGEQRKADRERYESMMEEIRTNTDATVSAFEEWANEHQLDDEQKGKIWDAMNEDLTKMSRGIFDKGIFDRYFKAESYEGDVEGAKEQGRSEGKNEAIEVKRAQMKGSGLPGVGGSGSKKEEEKNPREALAARMRDLRIG